MSDSHHHPPFRAPEPEEVALLFPAYDVHALIACGGMGAVYQATQRSLDRVVAIKILPREFSKDEAFRTGFEAEAKAMAKLNHPNLIGVYDFGEVDGMLFIVMEYVPGKSLFHSTKGQALEKGEALRIVSAVCEGLEHAHIHGILHRDIKPSNILIDQDANPKIGDFGLARALESEIQEGEQIFGTPGYTAPEVTTPPFNFDHRVDIFSVGVMLHELLTGKTPGDGDDSPQALTVANPRMNQIIRKATNPDPAQRFSSAAEFARTLDKVASSTGKSMASGPSAANPPGAFARSSNRPRYIPKESSYAGTIALVLLGVGAAAIIFFVKSQANKPKEVAQVADEPEASQVVVIETPSVPTATIEPEPVEDPVVTIDPVNLAPPISDDTDSISPEPPVIPVEPVIDSAEPKYDVAGFLDKGRGIMKEKVAPDLETYQEGLVKNTEALEQRLREFIDDQPKSSRKRIGDNLDRVYENWKDKGYLLPSKLHIPFRNSPELVEDHSAFFEVQTQLRETLDQKLQPQGETYITGIEFQIDRLEGTDDQPAIDLLLEEIDKVRSDPEYFESLMKE